MSAIDLLFLSAALLALAALLVFDKLSRVIVWECLRHPFTPSRIEVKDGKIVVSHPPAASAPANHSESSAGVR